MLNQAVENLFLVCLFNLSYFQGPYHGKINLKQGLIHLYFWGWGPVYKWVLDLTLLGRKGDMPSPVECRCLIDRVVPLP